VTRLSVSRLGGFAPTEQQKMAIGSNQIVRASAGALDYDARPSFYPPV